MKRLVSILIILLAGSLSSRADVVSPDRAASVAAAFFSSASTKAPWASVHLVATFPEARTKAPGIAPALYVFEHPAGGFVVVSGDDVAVPVTGYSRTGRFPASDMPVNLRSLLEWQAAVIEYARSEGWKPDAETASRWAGAVNASGSTGSGEVVLNTARWGQGEPFNRLCPVVDSTKCPSGCVATAMAIILRYHKHPERGTGTLEDYDFGWDDTEQKYTYHIDGYSLGHPYLWDKMPTSYNRGYSEEEGNQVAQLMYDLGVMSRMHYAPDGSGASSLSPLELTEHFGYDKDMRYLDREMLTDQQWEQAIRDEIDAGRPVFHCGFSENGGGHAFVIDGYRDNYFSINYGWDRGSAFYLLTPPVSGQDRDLTKYTKWQDMVTHIMPDQGGEGYVNLQGTTEYTPFPWDFAGDSFTVYPHWLWNFYSTVSGSVLLGYCLFDAEGRFKEAVSEPVSVSSDDSVMPETRCRVSAPVASGDQLLLSRKDGDVWTPLYQPRINYVVFDRFRKLSDMVTVGYSVERPSELLVDDIPYLYFDAYKDIWWEVSTETDGMFLTCAKGSFEGTVCGSRFNYQAVVDDKTPDRVSHRLYLPSGEYRVTFRNFNETLTFTVML